MNILNKALIGTAAAAAMAISATPVMAKNGDHHQNRHYKKHKKHGKIGAGEIIAGAVILGGIAAIASSASKKRHYNDRYYNGNYNNNRHYNNQNYNNGYYNNGYYNNDHNNGYSRGHYRISERKAVKRCSRATQRQASYYGRARVTEIQRVRETRDGWKIKGRVAVRSNYNRNNRYNRGRDQGKFTCFISNGQVQDVRLRGIG